MSKTLQLHIQLKEQQMKQTEAVGFLMSGWLQSLPQWAMGLLLATCIVMTGIAPAKAQGDSVQTNSGAEEQAPKPGQSEVLPVGDLTFQVTALRVTPPSRDGGYTTATLSMTIRNTGTNVVFLNATQQTAVLTSEHGYRWGAGNAPRVTGIDVANQSRASLNNPIEPGRELRIQYALPGRLRSGQTLGDAFDFVCEFQSHQDLGEGQLKKLRSYPVSFVGLSRSGGIGKAVGDGATSLLKGIFGSSK